MKKAKIILTALTVVAVVGGALAFKAQKTGTLQCGPTVNNCHNLTYKTTVQPDGQNLFCTVIAGDESKCTSQRVIVSE